MAQYKRVLTQISIVACGVLVAGVALAKPDTTRVPVTNTRSGVTVTIPARAVEVAPDVFHLGTAVVDGKVVEGLMIIDRRKEAKGGNPGKPDKPDKPGKPAGESSCYAYLAKGAKWKTVEPWLINPNNAQGLSDLFLLSNTAANIQKWEDTAGADVFGGGALTAMPLVPDDVAPDGQNEVLFGSIDSPGAIAVTITWGIFGGPPKNRELIEWDQVYDEVDYPWSDSGAPGTMDYENISTHELGHALGMGHPNDSCVEETMYRFADFGETKKRDLNAGDIAGIDKLY